MANTNPGSVIAIVSSCNFFVLCIEFSFGVFRIMDNIFFTSRQVKEGGGEFFFVFSVRACVCIVCRFRISNPVIFRFLAKFLIISQLEDNGWAVI